MNHWRFTRHIFTHSYPGPEGGEPECAIRCLTYSANRCHFYVYVDDYCFYGDFNEETGPIYGRITKDHETNRLVYVHPFIDEDYGKDFYFLDSEQILLEVFKTTVLLFFLFLSWRRIVKVVF